MKKTIALVLSSAFVLLCHAETFSFGSKFNPASVNVEKEGDLLRISCKFKPYTKFGADRNAEFNEKKAMNLCREGLIRYINGGHGGSVVLKGISVAGQHKFTEKEVEYYFTMPAPDGKGPKAVSAPAASPVKTAVSSPADAVRPETDSRRKLAVLTVIRYRKQDGKAVFVETKEYRSTDFNNPQAFSSFCDEQFSRIDREAEANMREIIQRFENERHRILKAGE